MPACSPKLSVCSPGIIPCPLHIFTNQIELATLLADDMRHVAEQLIQLAHALLDISNLGFALDDERVLEIDFFLRGQARLLFLQLL
jgi:hypothetical protein